MRPLFLLPALALLSLPGDLLRPHARVGEGRRVEFEQALRLEQRSQEVTVFTSEGDEPSTPGPSAEFVIEEREQVVFVDEVLEAREDRWHALRRRFERLESRSTQTVTSAHGRKRVEDGEGVSPLGERVVRFERADGGRWTARFDDEKGEEDEAADGLLAGLVPAWELAPFLPAGEVAVDDEWEVPLSAMRELSYPGGELGIAIEGDTRGDAFGRNFHDHLRGKIRARYLGEREVEGRTLAVIRLESELTTAFELVDDPTIKREYAFEFELEGELRWDRARGQAAALDWGGPARATTVTTRVGEVLGLRTRQLFEGTLRFAVRIEPR